MRGLILDLRFNTGGLLRSAIEITVKFVETGLIVKTQPRFGVPTWASATKKGTHPDYPLVVLINAISASASEIVSGALADPKHGSAAGNRAILVGERTFGKGEVLGITQYPEGGAQLKYTMAYYHLPSGKRVESKAVMEKLGKTDWGVPPNVKIDLESDRMLMGDELRKMVDVRRNNSVLVRAERDPNAPEVTKHTAEQTLDSDPQLAVGILVMRSKLIQAEALTMM